MKEVYSFKKPQGAGLILTNTSEKSIDLTFDVYFESNPPMKSLTFTLPPERVCVIDLSKPFAKEGYKIPETVFSLVLTSADTVSVKTFE